jgi:hypothetical protein
MRWCATIFGIFAGPKQAQITVKMPPSGSISEKSIFDPK